MAAHTHPRRLRHAPPAPRIRRIVLTDADYVLFDALERHGPLPSSYLYEFTRHLRRDRTHLQNRLTEFYNGDGEGSYLTRPAQQFAAYEARYQHLVYDLMPRTRCLLAQRSGTPLVTPIRSDPFVHRLMTACFSASFELAAASAGLRYISARDIVNRTQPTLAAPKRKVLRLPTGGANALIPDVLFGYEYPGRGFRFFAVECDRHTESIERSNFQQSSFGRKLLGYGAALEQGLYRETWGVPNLHVLTITTNAMHACNILTFVQSRVAPRHHSHFGISVAAEFGAHWRVPKLPQRSVVASSWQTPAGDKRILRAE